MDMEKLMDIKLNNSAILVTGGAGFIGSNLCEELLKHDCKVVCLDNFSTGKIENILHLFDNKNFKLIVGDILHSLASFEKTENLLGYRP